MNLFTVIILSPVITFTLAALFIFFYTLMFRCLPARNVKQRYNAKWAFISGATGGIGQAICHKMLSQGLSLIISSRPSERLNQLTAELREQYCSTSSDIEIISLPLDLSSTPPSAIVSALDTTIAHRDVGIAWINAGAGEFRPFEASALPEKLTMVSLNMISPLTMSDYFYKRLLRRDTPTPSAARGGLILTSSCMDSLPGPYGSMYSSTKAYLSALGAGMATERRRWRVDTVTLLPGPVSGTRFYESPAMQADKVGMIRHLGQTVISLRPQDVCTAALKAIARPMGSVRPVGLFAWSSLLLGRCLGRGALVSLLALQTRNPLIRGAGKGEPLKEKEE